MTAVFLTLISVLTASALCSLVEAAILSVPFTRVRILYDQGKMAAKDLLYIKEHISAAISSLVIVNNIINIMGSLYVGEMMADVFGDKWLGVISAGITFCIIFFGEIIPKTIGERFKVPVSLFFAKPMRVLMFFFSPLVSAIMKFTEMFLARQHYQKVTEDEIKIMLKLGRDAGTVEVDEEVLCNRVFKLNDLKARQIMKPITQVYALTAGGSLEGSRDVIFNSPYSRIVVRSGDPARVVGVVQRSVLLRELAKDDQSEAGVQSFMIKPVYVAETTRADTLLSMFQKYHQHLFVVQDAAGIDVGIVTMEDVLEELFGEIYDEKDMEAHTLRYPKK